MIGVSLKTEKEPNKSPFPDFESSFEKAAKMKSIFCLIAVVSAVVIVSAERPTLFEAYPSSSADDNLTEEQIRAKLSNEKLDPAQTYNLLNAYGFGLHASIFGHLDSMTLLYHAQIKPEFCKSKYTTMRNREKICEALDEGADGSVIFDNLSRYCHDASKRVAEYCDSHQKSSEASSV